MVYSGRLDAFRDSWRIVRGDQRDLPDLPEQKILGMRQSGSGFEGLIPAHESSFFPGCVLERPTLDEIMIFSGRE